MENKYETVIGLEVHVQLATRTKVFCGCSTAFGASPNSQVCPVCLGLPGVLPVLNKKAFLLAIKVAIALNCEIQKIVKFDRKNYYYPDLPKNYQISQYDMPIAYNGVLSIETDDGTCRDIGVTRAHLEEDAGKLIHDSQKPFSYVDLNRTGTPLLEIVSEPEIKTPVEAYNYLITLKQIVKYLEVSDCNMEEGSLRCDANISLRKPGDKKLGVKVEIKNLNSFKAVKEALSYEQLRQSDVYDENGIIIQETRLWDEKSNITRAMRIKEQAHDYRYFPEPDLVPFEVSGELVDEVRHTMPEMPEKKKQRFIKKYKLDEPEIDVLISEKSCAEFFEKTVEGYNDPQAVCNWIRGEVMMHANERGNSFDALKLEPLVLSKIISMEKTGKISGLAAKEVLSEHLASGKDPDIITKEKGLEQVSHESELEGIVEKVVSENQKSVSDFRDGKANALSFLIGQVMKNSKGKANPKIAGEMIKRKIKE